jgi:peptidoglycan/xylan/chitin deacetylase (PgdA/CDA1 family)
MTSVRDGVKHAVETALIAGGGAAFGRRKHAQHLLVLAYHNIVPTGSESTGDRWLHLSQHAFAEQLDALLDTHEVIPLAEALGPTSSRTRQSGLRPRAVLTFDDAYAGALGAGVAELRARALPATIFVTPGFLGGRSFWWDLLSDEPTGLDAETRKRALTEGRGLTDDVLELATRAGSPILKMPVHARGASIDDLNAAIADGQISLAAHTWNHPNLTSLSDSELTDELARPLEWLGQFGDHALPIVSYPYGLADGRVQHAARDAGYSAGFMIDGGWTTFTPQDRFAIPRLNVPAGVSRNGFVLRAAGLIQR